MAGRWHAVVIAVTVLACASVAAASPDVDRSNARKYRDAGRRPVVIASGGVVLEIRALLSRDGRATLEVSTGPLDSGVTGARIEKLQIKWLDGVTPVQNVGNVGAGYWRATYAGRSRGDAVQVQANLKDPSGRKNIVLSGTTAVVLRPDVTVLSLTGAPQVLVHTPVTFVADVAETNGDTGGRATCGFDVGQVRRQASTGIWVDAGDTVSCVFTETFDVPGIYEVAVAAEAVDPGDWDLANNRAITTITVVPPGTPIPRGYLQVSEDDYQEHREGADPSVGGAWMSDARVRTSTVVASGSEDVFRAVPTVRVDVTLLGNDVIRHQAVLTPNDAYAFTSPDYEMHCETYADWADDGAGQSTTTGDVASACAYRIGTYVTTAYFYQKVSGTAVYTSSDGWYGNTSASITYGGGAMFGWQAGTVVRAQLDFVDANGQRRTIDRSVTLDDRSAEVNTDISAAASPTSWYRYVTVGTRFAGNPAAQAATPKPTSASRLMTARTTGVATAVPMSRNDKNQRCTYPVINTAGENHRPESSHGDIAA